MKKKIGLGIVAALIIMQFFRIDKSAPAHNASDDLINMTQADETTAGILKIACYDCHSYETEYPWYTNVAPLSFFIKGHIKGGRQKVNFSEWASYDADKKRHKLEECVEVMEEGRMPMKSYTWLHPEAKLSDAETANLIAWFKSEMK